jgi:putative peptidoglycan lipid II flippase
VKATGGMAAVTLVSRLTGYVRDKTVAALLGAGMVTDAFYTALRAPNMFRAFLAEGALHAAFIPTLAELKEQGDVEKQREFVRAMTSTLLLILPVVVALGVFLAPWLVRLLAEEFTQQPAKFDLAVRLTRVMFPYLGLISLAALAQGVLNASDRFLLPAATPVALNLCMVAGTVTAVEIFHGRWVWLAIGVLAGGALQFAVQWPACRRQGLPIVPGLGAFRHPQVRRVLLLMLPGIPALGVYQLTLVISNRFAASAGSGGVTFIYNASRLNELVYGVLIVQLTTAFLPMLSAERARDPQRARDTLGFATRLLSFVAVPAAAFAVVMAPMIAGTAFGGMKYTAADVAATASALAMYAFGLPFLGLTKLLANTSYAWKDTRLPVVAAAVNLVVFYVLGVLWTPRFGVAGIAAAASVGQVVNSGVLLIGNGLGHRLPRLGDVLPSILRHATAAAAVGVGLHALSGRVRFPLVTDLRSLALLGATVVGAGLVYLLLLVMLGSPEWRELRQFISSRRTS